MTNITFLGHFFRYKIVNAMHKRVDDDDGDDDNCHRRHKGPSLDRVLATSTPVLPSQPARFQMHDITDRCQ